MISSVTGLSLSQSQNFKGACCANNNLPRFHERQQILGATATEFIDLLRVSTTRQSQTLSFCTPTTKSPCLWPWACYKKRCKLTPTDSYCCGFSLETAPLQSTGCANNMTYGLNQNNYGNIARNNYVYSIRGAALMEL